MSTFTFQGKEVFYTTDGDSKRPPLLILNGIMMSHKSWEPFLEALTPHFCVIRLDMLDQGLSSKMDKPYTQSLQVDMLKAFHEHVNLGKFHLAAISYGGSVAMQWATKHPECIERMVLLNAAAYTTPWLRDVGRGWNEVARTKNGEAYYHVTIPYIYSPYFYNENIDWMDARKEKLMPLFENEDFRQAMIRLTESAESHDVREELASIEVPTLVVAAEYDVLTPQSEQAYIVKKMPNAQMVTFDKCGHASMYEKPELFVQSLIGFLRMKDHTYTL